MWYKISASNSIGVYTHLGREREDLSSLKLRFSPCRGLVKIPEVYCASRR